MPGQGTAQLKSEKMVFQKKASDKVVGEKPQKEQRLLAQIHTLLGGPKKATDS